MAVISKIEDQVTVKPESDLTASTAESLREELKALLSHEVNMNSLVIDLANSRIMDSVGLGVLIAAHNSLSKSDGQLIISNASEEIKKLMKAMRLDQHFDIL